MITRKLNQTFLKHLGNHYHLCFQGFFRCMRAFVFSESKTRLLATLRCTAALSKSLFNRKAVPARIEQHSHIWSSERLQVVLPQGLHLSDELAFLLDQVLDDLLAVVDLKRKDRCQWSKIAQHFKQFKTTFESDFLVNIRQKATEKAATSVKPKTDFILGFMKRWLSNLNLLI